MDRLRKLWQPSQAYEPIEDEANEGDEEQRSPKPTGFSYVEYAIFLLLGISMLWAWNMFLAAGPYFQDRFRDNHWISQNFQAAEISVSTVTNMVTMLILTRLQANASYPKRIIASLCISMATFALLAVSTKAFRELSPVSYFSFLMVMIASASLATGLCQNGTFAYVSGFGQAKYTQGIMTGQAIAGVLPCIAQIISVLSVQGSGGPTEDGTPSGPPPVRPNAALTYFLTATFIAGITLVAFFLLLSRNPPSKPVMLRDDTTPENDDNERRDVPLTLLARKLFWLASAVFVVFGVTMMFPVFTQWIVSVQPPNKQTAWLQAPVFIPLAFLFWNVGDLTGRLLTAIPSLSLVHRPRLVFLLAVSRVGFVGLYHLCNIRGRGAVVESDFFYLVIVQLLFGLTNGYLGSTCMIGAGEWVEPEEREAAGGFMGLCLVAGLTVGSLASFFAARG